MLEKAGEQSLRNEDSNFQMVCVIYFGICVGKFFWIRLEYTVFSSQEE